MILHPQRKHMRKSILALTTVAILSIPAVSAFGQGQIQFRNDTTAANRITYGGSPIYGASGYRFGLYMGPAGSSEAQLTLVATTVNSPATSSTSPFAGVFNGGNPFTLPAGYSAGTTYAFQIRGWTYGDGTSYEAAIGSADINLAAGVSALGFVTPVTAPTPVPGLFGTAAGQVQGFDLCWDCPEPSTVALGGIGAAALMFFRRRK